MIKLEKCPFCGGVGSSGLAYFDYGDSRLVLDMNGSNVRISDDVTSFVEHIPINHCPLCGRALSDCVQPDNPPAQE